MTEKDFEALANALRFAYEYHAKGSKREEEVSRDMINAVAAVCASSNPRFDAAWFLAACGVKE